MRHQYYSINDGEVEWIGYFTESEARYVIDASGIFTDRLIIRSITEIRTFES